jgi:hypothetical protein
MNVMTIYIYSTSIYFNDGDLYVLIDANNMMNKYRMKI